MTLPSEISVIHKVRSLLDHQPNWLRPVTREQMNARVIGLDERKFQRKLRKESALSPSFELGERKGSDTTTLQDLPREISPDTKVVASDQEFNSFENLGLDVFSENPVQDILAKAPNTPLRSSFNSNIPVQDLTPRPGVIFGGDFLEEPILPTWWNNYQWAWDENMGPSGIDESRLEVRDVSMDSSLRRRLSKYSSTYIQAISRIIKVHSIANSSAAPSVSPTARLSIASDDTQTSGASTIHPGKSNRTSVESQKSKMVLSGAILKLDHYIHRQGVCLPGIAAHDANACWCLERFVDNSRLWVSETGLVSQHATLLDSRNNLFSVDLKFVDVFRNTALHMLAARDAPLDALFEVLSRGVNGNAKNTSGQSFLHLLSRGIVQKLATDQATLVMVLQKLNNFNVKFPDCDVLGRSFFHRLSQAANTSLNRLATGYYLKFWARPARDVAGWDVAHDPEIEMYSRANRGLCRFTSSKYYGRRLYEKSENSLQSIIEKNELQSDISATRPSSEFIKKLLVNIPEASDRDMSMMGHRIIENNQKIAEILCSIYNGGSEPMGHEALTSIPMTIDKQGLLYENAWLLETVAIALDEPTIEDSEGRNGLQCVAEVSLVLALKVPYTAGNPRKRRARDSLSIPDIAAAQRDSQPKPMQFRYELVWNLINAGVDRNNYDRQGNTVLMAFVTHLSDGEDDKNLTRIFQALIQSGANVHWRNRQGETALHVAVRLGRKVATKVLLESDANVHARTADGKGVMAVGETHYFKAREDPKSYASIMACMALCRDYGAVAAPTMVQEWSVRS